MAKQTVLLVGASGRTGQSIARGLLKHGNFEVKAAIRSESVQKSAVKDLAAKGVEIRIADVEKDSVEKLQDILRGVDILVSTVQIHVDQRPVLQAAKKAGVKRVVPSDFGTPERRGMRMMQDKKLDIRDFIKDLGLGYTFIEVGWWFELSVPFSHKTPTTPLIDLLNRFKGDGDVKFAYTSLDNIGEYVARILDDKRTLNQTVMTHDGEVTLCEAWKIAEKVTGEDFSDYPRISKEEIESLCDPSKADLTTVIGRIELSQNQYSRSIFVLGEDTVENAVKLGALDARKLYPDYKPESFEERAKKFYEKPLVIEI